MITYNKKLKPLARQLRKNQTEAELKLWYQIRRKQIQGIQFYRQKPLGRYIADFYAPCIRLVIEIDGGQHYEDEHLEKDRIRDEYLNSQGLSVLRFNNHEVMCDMDAVLFVILSKVEGLDIER